MIAAGDSIEVVMANTLKLPEIHKGDSRDAYMMLDYFLSLQLSGIEVPGRKGNNKPDVLVIENYFTQNFNGATVVPEIRGIMKLAAYRTMVRIIEVSPSMVKKHITGKGNSDKSVVRDRILEMYPNVSEFRLDENGTDAIAIGTTGIQRLMYHDSVAHGTQ
jgi:hypothetical protein